MGTALASRARITRRQSFVRLQSAANANIEIWFQSLPSGLTGE